MDRQTGPTMGPNGLFTDGDPQNGIQGSQPRAGWANGVTEELRNLIVDSGQEPDFEDYTQVGQAIRVLAGAVGGARNALINGGFQIWQRAFEGNVTASEEYIADRWAVRADDPGGSCQATIRRESFVTSDPGVPGSPQYNLRFVQTSLPTSGVPRMAQRIEDVRTFAGQTITISGSVRGDSIIEVRPTITQNFGSGGDASVAVGQEVWQVSAGWTRFEWTVAVPSTFGKSAGPGSFLELAFVFPQALFSVRFAQIQVELGSSATGFDERPLDIELLLCQRYYEQSYPATVQAGNQNRQGATRGFDVGNAWETLNTRFRVAKRATPAVSFYSPQAGNQGAGKIE